MALKFNNTEIKNVTFNGVELDKVYFNNILVFEKILGPKHYLRRIMPGDDLTNKTIYRIFISDLYKRLSKIGEIQSIVWTADDTPCIYDSGTDSLEAGSIFIKNTDNSNTYLYQYYNNKEYIDTPITIKEQFYVKSVSKDYAAYRSLYIEDENIRPIQLGDKIGQQTKIYFNFPDNLAQEVDIPSENLVKFSGWAYIAGEKGTNISILARIKEVNSITTIYKCTSDSFSVTINSSVEDCETFGDEEPQEVTALNSDFSQYILVDTRTLWN